MGPGGGTFREDPDLPLLVVDRPTTRDFTHITVLLRLQIVTQEKLDAILIRELVTVVALLLEMHQGIVLPKVNRLDARVQVVVQTEMISIRLLPDQEIIQKLTPQESVQVFTRRQHRLFPKIYLRVVLFPKISQQKDHRKSWREPEEMWRNYAGWSERERPRRK